MNASNSELVAFEDANREEDVDLQTGEEPPRPLGHVLVDIAGKVRSRTEDAPAEPQPQDDPPPSDIDGDGVYDQHDSDRDNDGVPNEVNDQPDDVDNDGVSDAPDSHTAVALDNATGVNPGPGDDPTPAQAPHGLCGGFSCAPVRMGCGLGVSASFVL